MSRITSGIGLVTGINIEDTVNQLMAVSARPRDILVNRTEGLKSEQLALDTLSSRVLSLQFAAAKLGSKSIYQTKAVSSSDPDSLAATLATGANPALGNYLLQPVRTASGQQFISQRFDSLEDAFGDGSFSFRVGGFANKGISLDELNNGAGVTRGVIRIADRSGAVADVDLTLARTVDDVLRAINSNTTIHVKAEAVGDSFRLTDLTGGAGTLSVSDIGGGATASDLGIAGISTTSASATGLDVFALHTKTKLSALNDGNGVYFTDDVTDVDDLTFALADLTSAGVDLSGAKTLGDVVDAINNDEDLVGKVTAAISADGNRLEVTDLTSGGGAFAVSNGVLGTAADDLGLTETAAGGVITGRRLASGLSDTLLSSLDGGQGVGVLGSISIHDRDGNLDTVDLSTAETLGDVIELINGSAAEVVASFNTARNGILITDDSGGTSNLTIGNADAANSADALGIAVDDAVESSNSGALNRQTLSEATLLSTLNGGKGVDLGDIELVDSLGNVRNVSLDTPGNEATTIADVIDAISLVGTHISARINDTGDGILVTDAGGGTSFLSLRDKSGDAAAVLNLTRAAVSDGGAPPTQTIDGSAVHTIDASDLDDAGGGILLSSLNGGEGVAAGDFRITDSSGVHSIAIDLNGGDSGIKTVDQLIDAINQKAAQFGVGVTASLNSAGTGILLTDTVGGPNELSVEDLNSTTAADLKLTGAVATDPDTQTQTIDGAGAFTAQSTTQAGIQALADRINDLDAGIVASIVFDGVGYRLALASENTGNASEWLIDSGDAGIEFQETAPAQDALLLYGSAASASTGLLLSSPDNSFDEVIDGVKLDVKKASEAPVTVSVENDTQPFIDAVQDFVDSYNAIREDLAELTSFDPEAATTGLLFGTAAALQVDTQLSRILTDRFFGLGDIQSLEQIGIGVDDVGNIELDSAKLQEAIASDAATVQEFFSNKQTGVVAKLTDVIDRLAGDEFSVLGSRSASLQSTIESNEERIEFLDGRLERERERLLLEFFQLEQIVSGLQQNLTALDNFRPVPPITSNS